MRAWLRNLFQGRPWWMNAMMVFCGYMAFVYVPWDFFAKPAAQDEEVWLGIMFHGWAAKATEPLHWAIYAAAAYGFRHMKPWMHPWAAVYMGSIALGMGVWSWVYGAPGLAGFAVGVVSLGVFGWLTLLLWRAQPLFQKEPGSLAERYGGWAVVTGASAGIGAEFAREFARRGMSCVLAARREDRLRALSEELEGMRGVSTRVVAVDLGSPSGADELADAVKDLDVGILVNNAGVGYSGRFDKQDTDRLRQMVQLNCATPVVLTSRLLPAMKERGHGAIIVVGSVAGRQPLPLHGVYSATKAFDLLFGESLYVELKEAGIDVIVLEPGATATEFQEVAGEIAHTGELAENVVRVTLETLGRQPSVVSGWFNWLRANAATRLLPRGMIAHIAEGVVAQQTPEDMK